MLLPSAQVRAALRLDTPAKRFAWAAEQLYGALFPSPAVAADIGTAVPAKAANAGILPTNPLIEKLSQMVVATQPGLLTAKFYLPFNLAQYHRGVPLLFCVEPIVQAPFNLPAVANTTGSPIDDLSPVKTFEQYLLSQLSFAIVNSPNADFDRSKFFLSDEEIYSSDYAKKVVPTIYIQAHINRTGITGSDRYSDIVGLVEA